MTTIICSMHAWKGSDVTSLAAPLPVLLGRTCLLVTAAISNFLIPS